ncbi:MAG: hypothetical protein AB1630_04975, partial [bacterium]
MEAGSIGKRLAVLAGGVCLFVLSSVFWAREAEGVVQIWYREPGSGSVGINVEIRGTVTDPTNHGYDVAIDFGTHQTITQVGSDGGNGAFTANFIVSTQSYGTKIITARVVNPAVTEAPATTTFFILPNLYYCYPQSGPVGELVTIMGNGFGTQTGTVTIGFGTHQAITTAVPNQNGTFSITFFVDTQTFGTKVITARDINNALIISTTTFFLTSKIYFRAPPEGTFGTTITIMGNGFPGTETGMVTIHFGITQSITSVVIDNANGTFSATFIVDTQPGGSNVITASGWSLEGTPRATNVFYVLPEILNVSPDRGTVSSIVTVIGRGYSGMVTIDFGTHQTITTTIAAYGGTFTITFMVSTQSYGTKAITARWLDGAIVRYAETTPFRITGRITIRTPASDVVGSTITIEGNGFGTDTTMPVIKIGFGSQETITTVVLNNANGTFSTTFLVNTQPYDTKVITVTGPSGNEDTTLFWIRSKISLVSPVSGIIGTLVTVEGTGYMAGTLTQIGFGISLPIGLYPSGINFNSSDAGTFSKAFKVNTQPGGTTVITGRHYYTTDILATSTFVILSQIITVVPLSGKYGDVITVIGNGYSKDGTVTIAFGTSQTIATGFPGPNGTFSTTFIVNTQPGNTRVITARDLEKPTLLFATSTFNVQGKIARVYPASGKVGSEVTVEGWGYDGTITVHFGTSYTIATKVFSDSATFTITFIVDTQSYGLKTITMSDIDNTGLSSWDVMTSAFTIVGKITLVFPSSGVVGSFVTVTGCGYGTNTTIRIDFGKTQTITTTLSDNLDGTFSTSFIVDTQPYDTRVITAYGPLENFATSLFFIRPKISLVSPPSGIVGTVVTVEGTGYMAGTLTQIGFGTSLPISLYPGPGVNFDSSDAGTFSKAFKVNTQPGGTTVITGRHYYTTDILATSTFVITSKIITVNPQLGTVGSTVTVIGNGYGTGTVQIDFGTKQTITTTTASINGTFSVTFFVNTQTGGTKVVTARDLGENTSLWATSIFTIQRKISLLFPASGTVDSAITLEGTGFKGTVTIDFGKTQTITTAPENENGTFSVTFLVNSQVYGTTVITARDTEAGLDTTTFIITTKITREPESGPVGTFITITGAGYGSETIQIDFGTHPTITTASAVPNGTFSITFAASTQPYSASEKVITVKGLISSQQNTTTFKIKAGIYFLTPLSGAPGVRITVMGSGYSAPDKEVSIWFGTSDIVVAGGLNKTSSNGTFSTSFLINTQPFGSTVITAKDDYSGKNATTIFVIIPQPLSISPQSGKVGDWVVVSGAGYGAGEEIHISFGTNPTITTKIATGNGTFSTSFQVDTQPGGTTIITAKGVGGTSTAYSGLGYYNIQPDIISLNPGSASVGTYITLIGNGYGSYTTGQYVFVDFGTNYTIATIKVNANGTFSTSFLVNTQPAGSTTITVRETLSGALRQDTTTFIIRGKIYFLNPTGGGIGTIVTIKASGYASSTYVYIDFGTTKTIATGYGGPNGTFSTTFVVNTQTSATSVITSRTALDINGGIATTQFTISERIYSLTPASGYVGDIVTIEGGYGYSGTVTIHFGTQQTITSIPASNILNGTFSTTFIVNTQQYGTIIITALDGSGHSATTIFKILPKLILVNPPSGRVESGVTVIGNGYGSGTLVRIDFGTKQTITSTRANANGTFSTTFIVNTQLGNTRVITAYQTLSDYATSGFNIQGNITKITPSRGTVTGIVTVEGRGYNGNVYIDFGTSYTIAQPSASEASNGTFSTTFLVDTQCWGSKTITARDTDSLDFITTAFTLVGRITRVWPTSGVVGSIVTVIGDGYGTTTETIRIDFGTNYTITTKTIDNLNGTFSITFIVSTQEYGTKTITVFGNVSNQIRTTDIFKIILNITLVTPQFERVGYPLTVEGTGYGSSSTIVIHFGTSYTITTVIGGLNGTFSTTFLINTQPYSSKTITVRDWDNNVETSIEAFTMRAQIYIYPSSGPPDTPVTVKGSGWSHGGGAHRIDIYFNGNFKVSYDTIDNGEFNAGGAQSFVVSGVTMGTKTITAVDYSTGMTLPYPYTESGSFNVTGAIKNVIPGSGPVGRVVTVEVDGYPSTDTVYIHFGTHLTITTATPSLPANGGTIAATFIVSTQTYGTKVITASQPGGEIPDLTSTFFITPKIIMVSPSFWFVGRVVTVQGTGYGTQNEIIRIDFGSHQTIAAGIVTYGNGTFSTTFIVSTQTYGSKAITASGQEANEWATSVFKIISDITMVSPSSGIVGTRVFVEGRGYNPGRIYFDFGTLFNTDSGFDVAGYGTFSITFIVSTQSYSTKVITAYNTEDTGIATSTFFILPYIYYRSPASNTVGSPVTIMGSGYGTQNTIIYIDFGTHITITTTTMNNNNGTFSRTFTVSTQKAGTTDITVRQSWGNPLHYGTTSFIIKGRIYLLSPASGLVGNVVTVMCCGYGSWTGTTNYVYIDFGNAKTIATTKGNANGTFSATFVVNNQPAGNTVITSRTNNTTYEGGIATTTFVIKGGITLVSPPTGYVGSVVTVTGEGYNGEVRIDFGTHYTITTTTANLNGTFSTTFIVSTQVFGSKQITASDNESSASTIAFKIIGRIILISPAQAKVGEEVTVLGTGYGTSGTTIYLDFGTHKTITTGNPSGENGTFSITFLVSTQTYGSKAITARALLPEFYENATIAFTVRARLVSVYPSSGQVGVSVVTVQGTGYGSWTGTETIQIDFGTSYTITTTITSENGTFSATFLVDTQPYTNLKTVTATGLTSGEIGVIPDTFQIKARIYFITPLSGQPGITRVTVMGSGYSYGGSPPEKDVSIFFGTSGVVEGNFNKTSSNGTFSTSFLINTQPFGTTVITAKDDSSGELSTTTFMIIPERVFVAPQSAKVGDAITLTGSGYAASETVYIHFGTKETITTTIASPSGSFSTTFLVNTQQGGTTQITAYGIPTSTTFAIGSFTITPDIIFSTPLKGYVGNRITIIGNGYGSGSLVQIDFGTHITIATVIPNLNGTFSTSFIVSIQKYGTKVITATDLNRENRCDTT